MTREEKIRAALEGVYGKGRMVDACAKDVDEKYDTLIPSREGRMDPLANVLWNWFSGGGTAEIAATRVRESVGE